jgi:hypothetical protein
MARAKEAKPTTTNENIAASAKIESAVIPGVANTPKPTPTPVASEPSMDDLDSLLLAADTEEKVSKPSASATPQITVDAILLKSFLEAAKARKDAESKEDRFSELLAQVAAPARQDESCKKNMFLPSVRMVADGVDGSALFILNRYTPVKPDDKRDAKTLLSCYEATLGKEEMKRLMCVKRGLVASEELVNDPVLLKKTLEALAAAGLGKYFSRTYEFSPSDEFHRGATLNADLKQKMKTLEEAKLVKPKKATVKAC